MPVLQSDPASLACGTVVFQDGAGHLHVTVIVKATYALRAGGLAVPAPPLPLVDGVDLAPCKRRADVVVIGRLHPRSPGTTVRQVVGFALARGPDVLLRKRLVALGDRAHAGADPAPLAAQALAWERTWGGAGCAENPVGVGLSAGDTRVPSLIDPDAPRRPVGLGPIAPSWSGRAAFLREEHAPGLRAHPLALPGDFDLRFFQMAPPDQQIERLRGGEQILLLGLHPRDVAVVHRLPALHAYAQLAGPPLAGRPRAVPLVGDTLWIDADRGVACLTFRGSVEVATRREKDAVLAAGEPWTVHAGMAACSDVEETIGTPRAWSNSPRAAEPASPTVDPVSVHDASGLSTGTFPWSFEPSKPRRVVVVKGTFVLSAEGGKPALASEQIGLRSDDPLSEDPAAELEVASDLAPFKARADVLLAGTAHAAPGRTTALVRLTLGPLSAQLVALGPRTWDRGGAPLPPGPFAPVPLRWKHAFGGPGHAANPAGTGFVAGSSPPLLEDPERLMRNRSDRPIPAGFAPVSPSWPARSALLGTYGRAWLKDRWPCFPADFDPAFFQAAPERLRCDPLRGDEPFALESVRADGAGFTGTLPGMRPRAFVLRGPEGFFEVLLRLDTVVFDTDAERLYLTWRGSFEVERAGGPVDRVFVVREDLGAPRAAADVAASLTALDEPRLAPASEGEKARVEPESAESFRLADHLSAFAASAGAGIFAARAARAATAAPGHRPPPAPPSRAEVEALVRDGKSLRGRDLSGADLQGVDLSRQDLTGVIFARARLGGARFAAAKLAGVNLSAIDAAASVWDGADLSRADLTGAKLAGASFLGAILEGASLAGAHLAEARLGEARADGADFTGADLSRAEAGGTHLAKAKLSGATLTAARLERACLDDASFYEVSAEDAVFDEASMTDARFAAATLTGCSFRAVRARGAVWEQADLSHAVLRGADVSSAVFSGARLVGADLGGVLARAATFRAADLSQAVLDGADLMQASFEGAILRGARLRGASLYQAELRDADVEGADLEGAVLTGTKLSG